MKHQAPSFMEPDTAFSEKIHCKNNLLPVITSQLKFYPAVYHKAI